jgi:hypothetical protein
MYGLPLQYVGQTGRSFQNDTLNIHAIRYNKKTAIYTKQILNTGHTYGNIQNATERVQIDKKGKHLNNLADYHTYYICQEN